MCVEGGGATLPVCDRWKAFPSNQEQGGREGGKINTSNIPCSQWNERMIYVGMATPPNQMGFVLGDQMRGG